MTQHSLLPDTELHEPKHIQDATTVDAGAVITPSSVEDGESVLRRIFSIELNDGASVVRKDDVQTLTSKRLIPRVIALTDAASITCDSDVMDVGAVTITANRTIAAPTGTPADGQLLTYRITQDGTGGWIVTWDAAFDFASAVPAPTSAAGTTAYYVFRWNSTAAAWQQVVLPSYAQQPAIVSLTDSSGGTADDTVAAITDAANIGSADVGPTADAIADLSAKVNAILVALRAVGLVAP